MYGHWDENVGAKVAKSSDPSHRISVTVVSHATIGSIWWKNRVSPMEKQEEGEQEEERKC